MSSYLIKSQHTGILMETSFISNEKLFAMVVYDKSCVDKMYNACHTSCPILQALLQHQLAKHTSTYEKCDCDKRLTITVLVKNLFGFCE